jgi:hypothetical protein
MKMINIIIWISVGVLFSSFFFLSVNEYNLKENSNENKNYIKTKLFLKIENNFKDNIKYNKIIETIKEDGKVTKKEFLLVVDLYFKNQNKKKLKEKIQNETKKELKKQNIKING